jgi:citrate synthase
VQHGVFRRAGRANRENIVRNAIEADERVSQELSAMIETLSNDPDSDEVVTLGVVRDRIRQTLAGFAEAERIHLFGDEETLGAEIDALIEEYGEDAQAIQLASVKASEDLSTIIEALMDDTEEDIALTLGAVRQAMAAGLVAGLAGDGLIEPDEEQTLLAEIEWLIERLGEDALAENVLRFE